MLIGEFILLAPVYVLATKMFVNYSSLNKFDLAVYWETLG